MERKFSRFEERKIVSESLNSARFGAVKEVQEKKSKFAVNYAEGRIPPHTFLKALF